MIHINLGSENVKTFQPKGSLNELLISGACLMVILYVPGIYAGSLSDQASAVQAQTSQNQSNLAKLREEESKINEFKLAISDLKARSEKIRNLNTGRKQPVFALDKLQQRHPDRLWLESIELKDSQFEVVGVAAEPELISEYASRIKSLNNIVYGSQADIENYAPPLGEFVDQNLFPDSNTSADAKGESLEKAADEGSTTPKPSVIPIEVSEVNILKSDLDEIDEVKVYRFAIQFKIKLPEGI